MREADYGFKPLLVALTAAFLLTGCAGKTLLDSVVSIVGNAAGDAGYLTPSSVPAPDENLDDDLG